jgi:predicted ATPase
MLGVELPECPTDEQAQVEYDAVWSNLGQRSIESLIELPLMNDPEMNAVTDIFNLLSHCAYFINSNLCRTVASRMVNMTLLHGANEAAVTGFAMFAIHLGPVFHRFQDEVWPLSRCSSRKAWLQNA